MERAVALVTKAKEATHAYLDDGQVSTLSSLDLDWFGIKLPQ
jgi:hypothetical protein